MKKSIFNVVFSTALILILAVSCTSPSEEIPANLPAINNKQRVASYSTLPSVSDVYDLPAYIGALHNASMYAFVEYVNDNNLSPYEVGGLTNAMIDTFAYNFVASNLFPILENLEATITVSDDILKILENEIIVVIDSLNDENEINNNIQERVDYIYNSFGIEGDNLIVYDVITEVTMATNVLWGNEWDFTTPVFEKPYYDSSNNNNGKSEEQVRDLKKADIYGAINGAIKGGKCLGSFAGPVGAAWGVVIGAATGAVAASIVEYIVQDIVECAMYIPVNSVTPNTYLYDYLQTLHLTNPNKYYVLFGNRFDSVIY